MLRWRYSHATRSNHGWVSFLWRISVFPIFFWQTYAKKSKSNESKLDNYFAIHSLKIVGKPRLSMFILIKNGWHSAVWSTWCSETIKEKRKSKVSSVCSRHVLALPPSNFSWLFLCYQDVVVQLYFFIERIHIEFLVYSRLLSLIDRWQKHKLYDAVFVSHAQYATRLFF